jgi:Tfp pilus assembly protein PilN
MAGMKLSLNLASRSYINRRPLYAFYAVLLAALIVMLGLNVSYYFRTQAQAGQLRVRMDQLNQTLAKEHSGRTVKFTQAEYDSLLKEIAFANGILKKDSFRWTELLNHLEKVVPDGVRIRGIEPNFKENVLNLTGVARKVEDLQVFLDHLIQSPNFREAYLMQQSRTTFKDKSGREREAVNFTIVLKGVF